MASPIFILGSVRSGTTILAHCLGSHPEVCWAHKADTGYELSPLWVRWSDLELGVPELGCRCGPAHQPASVQEQARLAAGLAEFHQQFNGGKGRLLLKHPHFWNKLGWLRTALPEARLVVSSRDLRSTVLSTQMLWLRTFRRTGLKHYLPPESDACWWVVAGDWQQGEAERIFPGGSVAVLAEYWLRVYQAFERDLAQFERPLVFHHEDLLQQPRQSLDRLAAELGLAQFPDGCVPTIDKTRNQRWQALLSTPEKAELDDFVCAHRQAIESLRCCDT
ncbi:MAG: sulfotransferase, partial [Candidatus Eremiobacteraeota bacterium]|nr:sulfotransferase [Candidatus Eremiobacteraeota bacterium]